VKAISVIGGTGALGSALAARLAAAGYTVCIGSRDPAKAEACAALIRDRVPVADVSGNGLSECAAFSDVVFLTVPYAAHRDTLIAIGPALAGKILVDATVPLKPPKVGTVQLPTAGAAALEAREIVGPGVQIVSALQTIGAEKLASGDAIDCDVLAASDDAAAYESVSTILGRIGLRTWHVGPLANAAAAEAMTSVLININRRYKMAQAGIRITGQPKGAPAPRSLSVQAIPGLPLIEPGNSLAELILDALSAMSIPLQHGDVLVIAQKAVSKAEGRFVSLANVVASPDSRKIAEQAEKPAEIAELIHQESESVMRVRPGVIIARHKLGHVAANAGIDASNVGPGADSDNVLLWPVDPDLSAQELRQKIELHTGVRIGVIISDSLGRAWRLGTVGTAIGVSGLAPLRDRCGESDLFGRTLQATVTGVADEIAAAASLVIGEANEGTPVAIVRGAVFNQDDSGNIKSMLRTPEEDLFS